MDYFDAVILGIVEGLTEFLPVSSTGHLTIAEKLLGLEVDDPAVTGFTAVIQMGAIAAVILYFARDIWRIIVGLGPSGCSSRSYRGTSTTGWAGTSSSASIPIGVVGLLLKDFITGPLRSLWVVAIALIAWSAVMVFAERRGRQDRGEKRPHACSDAIVVGAGAVRRAGPGRLALGRDDLGGPASAASTG